MKTATNTVGTTMQNHNPIRIYPNPFKDSFVVETSGMNDEPSTAELFNSLGQRLIISSLDKISGKTSIRHETPGIYTLRVSNQKEMKVFKIIGN